MVTEPVLFLNKNRLISNIEFIYEKALKSKVRFRPHFKTHQSLEIGRFFWDFGVRDITVSSLNMAMYFANAGWQNITVAFSVKILEIDKINFLASKIRLNILVE